MKEISEDTFLREINDNNDYFKSTESISVNLGDAKLEEISDNTFLKDLTGNSQKNSQKRPRISTEKKLKLVLCSKLSQGFSSLETTEVKPRIGFGSGYIEEYLEEVDECAKRKKSDCEIEGRRNKLNLYWDNKRMLTSSVYYVVAKTAGMVIRDIDLLPLQGMHWQTGVVS